MGRQAKRPRKHEPYYAVKAYQMLYRLSNRDVADRLGMAERTYTDKVNGFSDFTATEAIKLSEVLQHAIDEIFLT